MSQMVPMKDIDLDPGRWARVGLDSDTLKQYEDLLRTNVDLPSVVLVFDGLKYFIVDGWHRIRAMRDAGYVSVHAEVVIARPDQALWLGIERSRGTLSHADRRHAAALCVRTWPTKTNSDIARHVGCSRHVVARERRIFELPPGQKTDLTPRISEALGKRSAAKHAALDEEIRRRVMDGQPAYQIMRDLHVRGSYVALVRRDLGVSHTSDAKVAERQANLKRAEQLLREGQGSMAVQQATGLRSNVVAQLRRKVGRSHSTGPRPKAARAAQLATIRQMAEDGHAVAEIAAAAGVREDTCRMLMKQLGVTATADLAGKRRRVNGDRIVEHLVMDAEALTAGVNVVEIETLDPERLLEWVKSLRSSREKLSAFLRKLEAQVRTHHDEEQERTAS